ncbi:MAG: hypothetical protein ABTQ25_06225 [Nitrosomonas ureae]|uniref:hypothetical protein n=1 Tax=Nitrosomonas sp. TaxID=42353 RepID=UPI0025ED3D16|nr:hypothetical protein [Nitrosomonas sp.]
MIELLLAILVAIPTVYLIFSGIFFLKTYPTITKHSKDLGIKLKKFNEAMDETEQKVDSPDRP